MNSGKCPDQFFSDIQFAFTHTKSTAGKNIQTRSQQWENLRNIQSTKDFRAVFSHGLTLTFSRV